MTRQGKDLPSPIKGRLKALALGSDSDGPLLVAWGPESNSPGMDQARFSFLDPQTLAVLKVGPISTGGFQGIGAASPSGGSLLLHPFLRERVHIRASAGGGLFALWQTSTSPSGFQSLVVRKGALRAVYNHEGLEHLAPGPDGRTIYTGLRGPLDPEGKPAGQSGRAPGSGPELTIPSPDPAFYLTINGLRTPPDRAAETASVVASVHLAGTGTRLFTACELDEMVGAGPNESWLPDDFSIEKRFHLVPAADLLITVPPTNDRLVLRRLDIGKSLDQLGDDSLVVTSAARLTAEAGQWLRHRVDARSKNGAVTVRGCPRPGWHGRLPRG